MQAPLYRRPGATTLGVVMVALAAGLTGCAEEEDPAAGTEVELPAIRGSEDPLDPYIGELDASFRESLDVYADVEVTVLATVEDVLSPRAFTVTAPDGSEIDPVLVVVAESAAEMEPEAGEDWIIAATPLDSFDAGIVGDELGIDLPDDRYEEWAGEVFLVATVLEEAE